MLIDQIDTITGIPLQRCGKILLGCSHSGRGTLGHPWERAWLPAERFGAELSVPASEIEYSGFNIFPFRTRFDFDRNCDAYSKTAFKN